MINFFWFLSGSKFLCSVLVAPVRNENNDIILFILNLEDITDAPLKKDSYRNALRNSTLYVFFSGTDWQEVNSSKFHRSKFVQVCHISFLVYLFAIIST